MIDCARFERWLDEGGDEAAAGAEGRAHAASCARCAAALASARALDAALARSAVAAPGGFAERVMERVARARAVRVPGWIEREVLPWWVRAAAEPVTALSLALGALVLWQYPALARLTAAAFQALANPAVAALMQRMSASASAPGRSGFPGPFLLTGLVLAALPLAWWAGLAVYHWSGDAQALRTARH
jgi:hypothetical protein